MFGRGLAASAAALVLVASAGADERIFRLGLPADDAATAADTRDLALRGDDDAVTVEVRRGGYGGGGYPGGYPGGPRGGGPPPTPAPPPTHAPRGPPHQLTR